MEFIRYYIALVMLMALPSAILYWLIIHPYARFWRRAGIRASISVSTCAMILVGIGTWYFQNRLLSLDWGWNRWLVGVGLVLFGFALYFEIRCRMHLTLKTLCGLPELSQNKYPGRLLCQGIYSQVRHPRYIAAILGSLGISLFLNYPILHVYSAAFVLLLFLVIRLEERELEARFGQAYLEYKSQTPCLIPARKRPPKS